MTRIIAALPETGFELASAKELDSLMSIVLTAHPELQKFAAGEHDFGKQFHAGFYHVGFRFRLAEPSHRRYFISFVDDANEWLFERGLCKVSGQAFFAACLAHADVPWQSADGSIGALFNVGLDPYRGGRCSNAWRDLLSGKRRLLAPCAPRMNGRRAPEPSTARIYEQDDRTGEMRIIGVRG